MRARAGLLLGVGLLFPLTARAYITAPVQTLGQLCGSTYVTLVRVERISQEKGIILYRKVRDLKGTYPRDTIRHAFDLANTPQHKGLGDVPVRPDATDWAYALKWAEVGKTAVVFSLKYDPFGDFGHTYIDKCWYATMCPNRDWDFWYSIYSDAALLTRWHCGTPAQLAAAVEQVLAGKTAVVPTLVQGTKDEWRRGRGKIAGLKVGLQIQDYNLERDRTTGWISRDLPSILKDLDQPDRSVRLQALREIAGAGPEGAGAASRVAVLVQDKDEETRLAALEALAEIRPDPKAALPALKGALGDPNPKVRMGAVRAAGAIGAPARETAPLLVRLLPHDPLEVGAALARVHPESPDLVPALVPVLKEPSADRRLRAIELLAEIKASAAEIGPAVATLLADPAKDVRLRAAAVAAKSALPALIKAMKDADRDVRIRVAETLGRLGPEAKSAVVVLSETVGKDPSGTVRIRAADALAKIGPDAKSARPALEAAMKDPMMTARPEVLAKIKEVHAQLE